MRAAKFFPSVGDARGARGDQVVTRVFKLEYESAQQMVPILRPLVSPNNVINAFPTTNTLIITDYAENVKRIQRILEGNLHRAIQHQAGFGGGQAVGHGSDVSV